MEDKKYVLKYTLDKIIAAFLVLILSPLLLIIFIVIFIEGLVCEESKGSAIYKETRISQGRTFRLYKFRVIKQSVIDKMAPSDSATFLQLKKENVTRAGSFLIRFYLDEILQLFNVLKADMSMVGPRPRIPVIYEKDLNDGYSALKFLRGGITGPHQLSKGTPALSLDRSEEYHEKCDSYSSMELLAYDIGLLARTVLKVVKREGL